MPLIAALLAVLTMGSAALAQEPSRHGRALLKQFCGDCHAIDKTGDSPLAQAPPFRAIGASLDLDGFARQLQRGLMMGHPDMPEFKFSADDARDATVYLREIQQ
jgi:mono/diheme cytochrome c family protein